ncbi:pentapeptide MXKDX repeat protein [Caballeronia ptereochthonis]|uniref:Pentapeptide MXKDX repeat protein n=1 Tax=Caballeronia ptereochthonis TaxID=1777144 RepID=A0A158C1H0_9BURK|nr:pentapeptide MXKDX repeat protein [Caballeronia ptereochthonis]SAK76199.1 pentapeptide MXKDX repeat protein [Caballeronia ptereochthonis]
MKRLMTAVLAAALTMGTSAVFAQASGTMSNDAMPHDSMKKDDMSHDTMKKGAMSHDTMSKGDKMKKHDAMGMDHPASGSMSQ